MVLRPQVALAGAKLETTLVRDSSMFRLSIAAASLPRTILTFCNTLSHPQPAVPFIVPFRKFEVEKTRRKGVLCLCVCVWVWMCSKSGGREEDTSLCGPQRALGVPEDGVECGGLVGFTVHLTSGYVIN